MTLRQARLIMALAALACPLQADAGTSEAGVEEVATWLARAPRRAAAVAIDEAEGRGPLSGFGAVIGQNVSAHDGPPHQGYGGLIAGRLAWFAGLHRISLPCVEPTASLVGIPRWTGVRRWYLAPGSPWDGVARAFLHEVGPARLADLRDGGRVFLDPANPLLGTSLGLSGCDGFTGRLWDAYAMRWLADRIAAATTQPGQVPRLAQPLEVGTRVRMVAELLHDMSADLPDGLEVVCHPALAERHLVCGSSGASVDELLCLLSLAVGGEWRTVGGRVLYLAQSGAVTSGLEDFMLTQRECDGQTPGGRDAAFLVVSSPATGVESGEDALFPSRDQPIMELVGWSGQQVLCRILLVAWDASNGVLYALRRPQGNGDLVFGPRSQEGVNCAAAAILGLSEALGIALVQEARDTLTQPRAGAGPLDGNQLVALAKSVGVDLVGVKGTIDDVGARRGAAIVHLAWGHYVAVTDCDSPFVTLVGGDGRRARFPKEALASGMSGIMFVPPQLLEGKGAAAVGQP